MNSFLKAKAHALGLYQQLLGQGKRLQCCFFSRVHDNVGLSSEQDARLAQALETFDSAWLIRKQLDDYLGAVWRLRFQVSSQFRAAEGGPCHLRACRKEIKGMHFQGGLPKDYTALLNRFRFIKNRELIFRRSVRRYSPLSSKDIKVHAPNKVA